MNTIMSRWLVIWFFGVGGIAGGVEALGHGDAIHLTLRGVAVPEQNEVSGDYTVGDDGMVRLPMLDELLQASGLTPGGFARAAERAYRDAGIYTRPAIQVVAAKLKQPEGAQISVGGKVKRAGRVPFLKGMTMLQALDAAGGRDDFGGRNVILFRNGRQYCLDFRNLAHKNAVLEAGDSLQVDPKPALLDRWKGTDEQVKGLF